MRFRGHSYSVDYGHLIFVTAIAAASLWYLLDARSVSTSINNLLLVEPVAIFALLMYALILPQCFRRSDEEPVKETAPRIEDPLAPQLPTERREVIRMLALGAALGVFVFILDVVGFDIAIFLFAATAMVICGERRPHVVVLFAVIVALAGVYGFRALIPFPMFTAIL